MERKIKDMEKLELKHLSCYLPYGLNCIDIFSCDIVKLVSLDIDNNNCFVKSVDDGEYMQLTDINPILRPLSDLFKLIDWDNNNDPYMIGYKYGIEKVNEDGIEFYANEYYADYAESPKCYIDITSFDWWLFEKHFDVFGLIDKGLAIDINKI